MTKQLTTPVESFIHSRKLFWFVFRFIIFLIFLFLILFVLGIIREQSTLHSLDNTYSQLTTPRGWVLEGSTRIPTNALVGCFADIDLTCPSNTYTYNSQNKVQANEGIVTLKDDLSRIGFTIDGTCFRDSCHGYGLHAHNKNGVAVRASAQEIKESYAIYLIIEKD